MELDSNALEDLEYWASKNPKQLQKIFKLIRATLRTPFEGLGKPEALKHDLSGCWSRHIDGNHRLVYKVENCSVLIVLACRFHYNS